MFIKQKLVDAKDWYKDQLEKRPQETVAASIGLVTAVLSLWKAGTDFQNAQTWRKEVKRRQKKDENNK